MYIDWDAPSDNHDTIDQYLIEFLESDGETFTEDTTDCNGDGTDPLIVSNTECTVPMQTFRDPPYSLSWGDVIQARVWAHNSFGWSIVSQSSTSAATVQTEPV